jgi:hypothetical protein
MTMFVLVLMAHHGDKINEKLVHSGGRINEKLGHRNGNCRS